MHRTVDAFKLNYYAEHWDMYFIQTANYSAFSLKKKKSLSSVFSLASVILLGYTFEI